ncbi:PLP-dependent aminotransferase family protein [Brevibacterium sp.]|uniref:MocR-like transcription factor YczR n=1 Tax=Brevibacterium sp. TaxID=1701 RepID=UPI0028120D78|nr:PLP-dependent aminotransferase family protein [Brevibacterium sp.]
MGSYRLSARALLDLVGELDPSRAVYEMLAERIRLLIMDGRIPAGTRLPSERELAARAGRSRTTIVASYQSLRDAGYLVSRQGSGSSAALPDGQSGRVDTDRVIDFARAVPPPVAGLEALFASVSFVEALNGPGFDLQGRLSLRSAIARRYSERGLLTTPEQIMVTMGGQHAIALIAHTVISRADSALIEAPTYPHAYDALRRAGARLVTTPVTTDGWDLDHLLEVLSTVRPVLAYLVPDFHNPTGASMLPEERTRVVETALASGTTLVIDETTADLDIDRDWDDGPFARHVHRRSPAGSDGVITLGSLSKSIWGGLRLGWVRASTSVIRRLVQARPAGDLGTPQMEQLLAEQIVTSLPQLLAQRRELLREHREALSRLLTEHLPGWTVPAPHGGLSLWAQLDRPASSALTSVCEAHGLSLVAGPKFSIDGAFERFLRLPFTSPIADLNEGVRILARTWAQLSESHPAGHAAPQGLEVV